jgi:hypothetical protein
MGMKSINCSYGQWEPYFAWLPKRTITNNFVWFKKIYRREYFYKPLMIMSGYEYATVFDLIAYT